MLLSDAGAVALVVTLITGLWLWLSPRVHRAAAAPARSPAAVADRAA